MYGNLSAPKIDTNLVRSALTSFQVGWLLHLRNSADSIVMFHMFVDESAADRMLPVACKIVDHVVRECAFVFVEVIWLGRAATAAG